MNLVTFEQGFKNHYFVHVDACSYILETQVMNSKFMIQNKSNSFLISIRLAASAKEGTVYDTEMPALIFQIRCALHLRPR